MNSLFVENGFWAFLQGSKNEPEIFWTNNFTKFEEIPWASGNVRTHFEKEMVFHLKMSSLFVKNVFWAFLQGSKDKFQIFWTNDFTKFEQIPWASGNVCTHFEKDKNELSFCQNCPLSFFARIQKWDWNILN